MSVTGESELGGYQLGTSEQTRARHRVVSQFNQRLLEAMDAGFDVKAVMDAIDPDPARYTDVDEGGGILPEVLRPADALLAKLVEIPNYRRYPSSLLAHDRPAARPAVCAYLEGFLIAGIEWREGSGEQVVVRTLDSGGLGLGDAVAVSGSPADCLRPSVLVDDGGQAWVFFGLRRDGAAGVWYTRQLSDRWESPELLSTPGQAAFNQEAIVHRDGTIECCWQELIGDHFAVYTRRYRRGTWSVAERISDPEERNVWDPVVAALPGGGSAYAWTTYGDNGYITSLLARRAGQPEERFSISEPEGYSLHPCLAVSDGGDIWCATDAIKIHGHGGSGPTRLRARADLGTHLGGSTRPDGRAIPGDLAPDVTAEIKVFQLGADSHHWRVADSPAKIYQLSPAALPRITISAAGAVIVAYRVMRRLPLMLYFWETVVQELGQDGWSAPIAFEDADGPLEEIALAANGAQVLVAWKQDGRRLQSLQWTEGFGGAERPELREHYGEVIWNTVDRPGTLRSATFTPSTPGRAPATLPAPEVTSWQASRASAKLGGDARPWALLDRSERASRYSTTIGEETYSLYWGDLHRHSLISRCTAGDEPSLEDFYHYAWDVCEYDFWAVTDHAENTSAYQWAMLQKIADVLHIPNTFVPFYGFEWTGATGHQNVIYESLSRGVPIYSSSAAATSTPEGLWRELRRREDLPVITIPHHPGSAMVPFDWNYRDDTFGRLVEIFQACRGNYENEGCFRQYSDGTLTGTFVVDGLSKGHQFGFIASSDHGNGASYVGAFAPSLNREEIFAALYQRRTFAATTRDIVIDFRVNETFMGSQALPCDYAVAAIKASAYGEIARVEIIRDGTTVKSWQPELGLPQGWVAVPLRVEWRNRAIPAIDWSGGLSVGGEAKVLQTPYWSPEITEATEDHIRWSAATRNFSSQYGSQRGGIEVTVIGESDAVIDLDLKYGGGKVTLGRLLEEETLVLVDNAEMYCAIQRGTGGLAGMGSRSFSANFTEEVTEPHYLYARLFLVDGEMAWSSPVWINPSPRATP